VPPSATHTREARTHRAPGGARHHGLSHPRGGRLLSVRGRRRRALLEVREDGRLRLLDTTGGHLTPRPRIGAVASCAASPGTRWCRVAGHELAASQRNASCTVPRRTRSLAGLGSPAGRDTETGFMQSSWWAEFRTTAGFEHFGVMLKNSGAILGGAVVLRFSTRTTMLLLRPEGPVLPGDAAVAGRCSTPRSGHRRPAPHPSSRRSVILRIEPRWQRLPGSVSGSSRASVQLTSSSSRETRVCRSARVGGGHPGSDEAEGGTISGRPATRRLSRSGRVGAGPRRLPEKLRGDPPPGAAGTEGQTPDTFQALLSCSRLATADRCSSPNTRARESPPPWWCISAAATYFYGGSLDSRREVHGAIFCSTSRSCARRRRWAMTGTTSGARHEHEPDHPWRNITVFKRQVRRRGARFVPTLDYPSTTPRRTSTT